MKYFFTILVAILISFNVNAKTMTMVDMLNVPSIRDVQISPDGKNILFEKRQADWQKNTEISTIWLASLDGSRLLQVTSENWNTTSARWSPDGSKIIFLSSRGDDKTNQIYLMPSNGGEAERFSNHLTGITSPEWSADGKEIYFLAHDEQDIDEKKREEKKDDIFKFEQNYQQRHLWKISLINGEESRITSGDYSISRFDLSLDGKQIVFHKAPNPLLDADLDAEIWTMDSDGRNQKRITDNKNPESGAELSPDNKTVLYLSWTNENDQPYFESNLFIVPAGGGEIKQLLGSFDHDIQDAHWSKDGKSIYFKANLGVHNELFSVTLSNGKITQLTDGKHTVLNWRYDPNTNRHIMSLMTAHNNGDFWYLDNGKLKKITAIFDHLEKDFDLPEQDVVQWKGDDGVSVEGIIIYPNGYQKGRRYPLVVQTHGGPRSSDQWGIYNPISYATVLAANGYVILQPNYRGSLGYGDAFVRDMVGHYFNQSHLDVMAGIDYLIDQGIADGDKLVKMGYSAGGHMTNKLITFTDRFKAASSAAGAANWISMYSQSDTRIYRTPWFGGTPWQKNAPIDSYWDNSPLKDISNVTTPTLIIVGGADTRVPQQQSIELYRALKSNGVDTDLYIVPRENHIWKELRHYLGKMNVEMSWFEKYINNREFEWEKAPE
ncbi:MAG: S9 family peptidase [Alphaproteobacteria bacterium]|nr:S9 family peptidase [Alphaproteobacteria bacterium]HPF45558.1 S9 family peptidase [Emcibacteraceae bacterium]